MKNPSHNPHPIPADLKALISAARRRRTKLFTYGFVFAFVACTAFLAFNPSSNAPSPWFHNLFSSSSSPSSFKSSIAPYRAQVSSFWNSLFFNSSSPANNPAGGGNGSFKGAILRNGSAGSGAVKPNRTRATDSGENGVLASSQVKHGSGPEEKKSGASEVKNQTATSVGSKRSGVVTEKAPVLESKNQTNEIGVQVKNNGVLASSQVKQGSGPEAKKNGASEVKNQTATSVGSKRSGVVTEKAPVLESKNQANETGVQVAGASKKNQTTTNEVPLKSNGASASAQKESKANSTTKSASSLKSNGASASAQKETKASNSTTNLASSMGKSSGSGLEVAKAISSGNGKKREKFIEEMIGCDLFKGHWVKDDSYPLYPEGSCPHIDEPFDCYLNGRQDRSYQKLRWQPDGCNIPRLNATDMLERLRGKRLVFVGDSLNRNMWESLVCVLRNSARDKKTVFEASGRHEFRTEGSYSFLFKDYGTTIEFFRSPFLVQEWEMPIGNGTKETLRLDIIERSSSKYKDAHVIIFNTGHWWTHDKTAKGKDYYQEGNKVYGELNVVEAFHKALNTWAKWVDHNVDPKKSIVFFRGYSASHFRGGQWNSGGACDKETEPIKNEAYLSSYPPKMTVLEQVIKEMKTPVAYLNITRMTDYRKDAHPSVYRKQNLTEEEMRDPLRFQDCSHWCLPGVPDSWNELVYAQLIVKQYQMAQ